jgi:hypothetical protein
MGTKVNGINQIRTAEYHPEKAGVGGSIPSLATIYFKHLQEFLRPSVPMWSPFGVQLQRGCVRGVHGNHVVLNGFHVKSLSLTGVVSVVAARGCLLLSRV